VKLLLVLIELFSLGATYHDHLRLIGKHVVDFLLNLNLNFELEVIELFC